ncbi:Phosphonate-binding periplasmic protein [Trichormus variabilis ATCC 29413]|uniref:Phosphonate-binding periplasmic protein n=2 Tax=Anabaena variabilis TaxID=264691 RepID=Q3M533_TRIV2|nr:MULTISPECIES: phosphate/phosphite/phosphonate ABC transporter substrate-binding protein [Nostocaceae]ABA23903.1 Phosphonate-binding periplasmic protein [Trichormus variabilis ATCC 29413]MBC1216597.1 phosphate/phosphite/phosphonate ABC transporter substrate-binding protein [Trichormus variabilis ARAD]MBC1255607.1 phosphate/phosphite/phosphonate ABC transporter substrate-binding protein [Trichormus variabilis V5]MBC1266729.1 phosphate/phosphite/phosphonate ABC transporter substrate-binding pro
MKKAVQWLISRKRLFSSQLVVVTAIAYIFSIGCHNNISSNNQSLVNKTSSQKATDDIRVVRRTRERQGTVYDNTSLSSANKNDLPKLKIGVLSTQNFTEQQQIIKPLNDYLETSLGRQVDFFIAKDHEEIIEWLTQDKLDLAYLGSVAYLEAVDRGAEIQPLVTSIDKHTGQPWYRACIIVKADSSIKTLKDLKGKRVAFVDKSSTSGYLMPLAALSKQSIDPQKDFRTVIYVGNHSKSIAALENGSVDAAATNVSSYITFKNSRKLTPQDYRLIWESAPIPNFPIVISQKLAPELIQQLKQVFISTPEGMKDILGAESAGYTLVSPDHYAPIQQLRQELNLISIPKK